jgi:glycosyltransferase involved in cell wall biosynthesis
MNKLKTHKILHICGDYFNTNIYKEMNKRFIAKQIDTIFYVPDNRINNSSNDSNVILFNKYNKIDRLTFFLKQRKIYKNLNKIINDCKSKPSIIHAHFLFSNGYIAYKIKKKYNIPYIVAVRNTDVNVFFKKAIFLRGLGKRILVDATKIVFLSDSYKNIVLNKYVDKETKSKLETKCIVIPNGIDDFWQNNKFRSLKKINKNIKLLQVGDINENKNITKTLEAVESLNQSGIPITLTAVGEVKDSKIFNRISKNRFLLYLGVLDKSRLLNVYREHDIFVLPSHKETFGLVYAEALSQSLPVLYTKNQGFDKQFAEGTVGYSVNSNNSQSIIDAIKKVIENYDSLQKNTINGSDKFLWDKIIDQYIEIYQKI